tara:strand:- start:340 stop:1245 length:906 start_codon:yes stop_codon:yes gene_type:complete
MLNAILIVHPKSFNYISTIVNEISTVLNLQYGRRFNQIISEDFSTIPEGYKGDIYIMSDLFPRFEKSDLCKYIFFNFSLLIKLGGSFDTSNKANRWIKSKKKLFLEKVDQYDYVLDYYPSQTKKLKAITSSYSEAIFYNFPILIPPVPSQLMSKNKKYDFCVVGEDSKRRIKLYKKLQNRGFKLSPLESKNLGEIIRESKVVLNIHAEKCNTLEFPRIVEALANGAVVLTEKCFELDQYFPKNVIFSSSYRGFINNACELIGSEELNIHSQSIIRFYSEYYKKSKEKIEQIIELVRLERKK